MDVYSSVLTWFRFAVDMDMRSLQTSLLCRLAGRLHATVKSALKLVREETSQVSAMMYFKQHTRRYPCHEATFFRWRGVRYGKWSIHGLLISVIQESCCFLSSRFAAECRRFNKRCTSSSELPRLFTGMFRHLPVRILVGYHRNEMRTWVPGTFYNRENLQQSFPPYVGTRFITSLAGILRGFTTYS